MLVIIEFGAFLLVRGIYTTIVLPIRCLPPTNEIVRLLLILEYHGYHIGGIHKLQ